MRSPHAASPRLSMLTGQDWGAAGDPSVVVRHVRFRSASREIWGGRLGQQARFVSPARSSREILSESGTRPYYSAGEFGEALLQVVGRTPQDGPARAMAIRAKEVAGIIRQHNGGKAGRVVAADFIWNHASKATWA